MQTGIGTIKIVWTMAKTLLKSTDISFEFQFNFLKLRNAYILRSKYSSMYSLVKPFQQRNLLNRSLTFYNFQIFFAQPQSINCGMTKIINAMIMQNYDPIPGIIIDLSTPDSYNASEGGSSSGKYIQCFEMSLRGNISQEVKSVQNLLYAAALPGILILKCAWEEIICNPFNILQIYVLDPMVHKFVAYLPITAIFTITSEQNPRSSIYFASSSDVICAGIG